MNARDPQLPVQPDEASALADYAQRSWTSGSAAGPHRLHRHPGQEPDVRRRLAGPWLPGARGARYRVLDRRTQGAGSEARGAAPGRAHPLIFFDVPATRVEEDGGDQTVVFYGHLDKQPEFNGWRHDLGPWTPKYENGKLYGRGGADDGYAAYAAITAIEALDAQGITRPRCVGLIETCEESGSGDLPAYLDALRERLGRVALVVCLDSGAGSYDQLWLTTSLRGMVSGVLKVEVLGEGIHSGDASGVVPSSFRILRHLRSARGFEQRRAAAAKLRLRGAGATHRAGPRHRRDPEGRGLQALSLGLRRRRRRCAADHHRSGAGAAEPHLAAHAQRHGCRGLPRAGQCRQCAAALQRLQAQSAPAAAGGRA